MELISCGSQIFTHKSFSFFLFFFWGQILKIGLCGLLHKIGATTYDYIPNFLWSNKDL